MEYKFNSKKQFRALCSTHIWRYGYINPSSTYLGEKEKTSIIVPMKGGYIVENKKSIGICSFKKDSNGKVIYSGDILENKNGQKFEVRFGEHAMYCPVDNLMEETVGFYTVSDGIYEDMPLGPTEEYSVIIGNIIDNPEYKVPSKYRCPAELNLNEV